MGIFRNFPYSNFHEMNLDWLLNKMKALSEEWANFLVNWEKEIKEEVDSWLTAHPEATTTVMDNSITEIKLAEPLKTEATAWRVYHPQGDSVKYGEPVMRDGNAIIANYTYGNKQHGSTFAVRGNNRSTQIPISGATTSQLASNYWSIDSVALFVDTRSVIPTYTLYDAEEVTESTLTTNTDIDNAKIGMFVEIIGSTNYLGKITDINERTITVDGWYDNSGIASTPDLNEVNKIYINRLHKFWAINANTNIEADSPTDAVVAEFGVANHSTNENGTVGLDVVNLHNRSFSGIIAHGDSTDYDATKAFQNGVYSAYNDRGFYAHDNVQGMLIDNLGSTVIANTQNALIIGNKEGQQLCGINYAGRYFGGFKSVVVTANRTINTANDKIKYYLVEASNVTLTLNAPTGIGDHIVIVPLANVNITSTTTVTYVGTGPVSPNTTVTLNAINGFAEFISDGNNWICSKQASV